MIVYLVLKGLHVIETALLNLIPSFETPAWFLTTFPQILSRVMSFNQYLPLSEVLQITLFILPLTLGWKVLKVLLGIAQIDLGK